MSNLYEELAQAEDEIARLRAQRDKLLAACENLVESVKASGREGIEIPSRDVVAAEAAIAAGKEDK